MFNPAIFPFCSLSNAELIDNLNSVPSVTNYISLDIKNLLTDTLTEDIVNNLEFKYYTPCQLNNLANQYRNKTKLSMFHVNIRSLNANFTNLISYLHCLSFSFDVIILSEIWSTNLSYYSNLLPDYDFFMIRQIAERVELAFMQRNL